MLFAKRCLQSFIYFNIYNLSLLIRQSLLIRKGPDNSYQVLFLRQNIRLTGYSAAMTVTSTNSSGRARADSPQARAGG